MTTVDLPPPLKAIPDSGTWLKSPVDRLLHTRYAKELCGDAGRVNSGSYSEVCKPGHDTRSGFGSGALRQEPAAFTGSTYSGLVTSARAG